MHEIPLSRVRYDRTFRLLGTGEVDEPGEPRGSSPTLKPVHKAEKSKPNSIRDPTSHGWMKQVEFDLDRSAKINTTIEIHGLIPLYLPFPENFFLFNFYVNRNKRNKVYEKERKTSPAYSSLHM